MAQPRGRKFDGASMSAGRGQTQDDVLQRACDAFQFRYGRPPYWVAAAPGRVNLIGEFTDYNKGFVLPMALEQRTAIAAAPNASQEIIIRSESSDEVARIDLAQPLARERNGSWVNYPKGVVAGFLKEGVKLQGFDAIISSRVPIGAGLSSSAALQAATATVLEAVSGVELDAVRKALLCQAAENAYPQVPCGIMDPFISILGRAEHVLLLDCLYNEPAWIPLTDPSVAILIVNTNIKHELAKSQYGLRRQACETAARALSVSSLRAATAELLREQAGTMDESTVRCARHVVSENARTLEAAQCIRVSDWAALGSLMYASHVSLRDDYAVSCAELDTVVDIALDIGRQGGVFGCRMTGGGFGGCAVALIESAKQEGIAQEIGREYHSRTGIEASVFVSRPSTGAQLIEL
jgi:galactokinase